MNILFVADPLEVFKKAMDNVKPKLEVKSRRVGGATYQVPVEVRPERRVALAMRWLVQYSRDRGEKTMRERLAGELVDAAAMRGNAGAGGCFLALEAAEVWAHAGVVLFLFQAEDGIRDAH